MREKEGNKEVRGGKLAEEKKKKRKIWPEFRASKQTIGVVAI